MKSNKVNSDEKLQQSKSKAKNKAIKQTFCQFLINKNIHSHSNQSILKLFLCDAANKSLFFLFLALVVHWSVNVNCQLSLAS